MVNDCYGVNQRMDLFQGMRPLRKSEISRNLLAGLTLAAMNIPQALGYTRIAGTPVITGLYTLLLPLVAFATFGASRYLVVSADSATAAILAGGLAGMAPAGSPKYAALASLLALTTGLCLLVARLLRLGFLADFLSQTVLIGFLTGVGFQVSIAVLGEIVGVDVRAHRTVLQLGEVIAGWRSISWPTLALSGAVIAWILVFRRYAPKFPAPLIAVAGAVAASSALGLEERGIRIIGPIAGGLPALGLPPGVGLKDAIGLLPVAGSCLVMIVAQSAATARAYAFRHGQPLNENRDLVGLGAANLAAAASGAFVVNGSPTQTAMVERSGGRGQIAHLATAATVALVLLFLTGPLRYLPNCVLGAVVFTIAIDLIDLRGLRAIRRESPGEFWLALITTGMVVLVGVEQGIVLAMILSLLRIVQHSYSPHTTLLVRNHDEWRQAPVGTKAMTEPGVMVYRFGAPLFYANASRFSEEILSLVGAGASQIHWLLVDAGAITRLDYSAAKAVLKLQRELTRRGVKLGFAHAQAELRSDMDRHHLTAAIGVDLIFDTLHEAMAAIHEAEER